MKRFAVIFFLILSFYSKGGRDFNQFNIKASDETNLNKLNQYRNEELTKYQKTKDHFYLCNSKFAEYYLVSRKGNAQESLRILSSILEDSKCTDKTQMAWANYHMASSLIESNAVKLSREYAQNALRIVRSINDTLFLPQVYSLNGSYYFKINQFEKAKDHYSKAFYYSLKENFLFKGSMLNNIGLCEMRRNNFDKAYSYFKQSMNFLSRIRNQSEYEKTFAIIVEGNIGTILNKLGNHKDGIVLLEKELAYYQSHSENIDLATQPLIELLNLYHDLGLNEKLNRHIEIIERLEPILDKPKLFPLLTEAMMKYYHEIRKNDKELYYSQRFIQKLNAYSEYINDQNNELIEILYRDKLKHLKENAKSQNIILENAIEEKKKSQLFSIVVIIVGILISVIAILVFKSIKKNAVKDSLIQKQKQEIEANKNKLLESEIRLNQDKIASLAMNLTLKKETEKAFLTKINELKRKKNVDTEETIRDLQLSVTNLLSIDKKMIHTDLKDDEVNKKFKSKLKALFPGLSKTDLEYCCHFRLNLSAKQIGSIQGISDVSVRVTKNRIKNKLGLKSEQSITDFLNDLSVSETEP